MGESNIQKKRLIFTSLIAIFSFVVNVAIGLFTSPYIVGKLGSEAYGFSTLGGNITTYMTLFTVAINSFASRYITIALQKKDFNKADQYFTSVFFANIFTALIMFVPCVFVIANVNSIFNVSGHLVGDVKLQWFFLFLAWGIELVFKVFSIGAYAKNRLDINHILATLSYVSRLLIIISLFSLKAPKLWFLGIASLVCTIIVQVGFVISKKKLMPEVTINRKMFSVKCLKELIVKGIWNSINQLAGMLMNGFDLMITNWIIDASTMGIYSIAQTLPTYLQNLMYMICDISTPNLTICYANKRIDQVKEGLLFAIKMNSALLLVPLLGFWVFGEDFYRLWQYSLNENDIHKIFVLSFLVLLPMISGVFIQPLLTVNTITARLRLPVIINIVMGVLNIIIEVILVKTTNLGIYAIAGVSSILLLLRNFLFYPIYSAKNLGLSAKTFYPIIIRGVLVASIIYLLLRVSHGCVVIRDWFDLLVYAILFGMIFEIMAIILMLNRDERKNVIKRLFRKGV